MGLEVTWTVVPLVLFLAMFYLGWTNYEYLRNVPDDAMVIEVISRGEDAPRSNNATESGRADPPLGTASTGPAPASLSHGSYPSHRSHRPMRPDGWRSPGRRSGPRDQWLDRLLGSLCVSVALW